MRKQRRSRTWDPHAPHAYGTVRHAQACSQPEVSPDEWSTPSGSRAEYEPHRSGAGSSRAMNATVSGTPQQQLQLPRCATPGPPSSVAEGGRRGGDGGSTPFGLTDDTQPLTDSSERPRSCSLVLTASSASWWHPSLPHPHPHHEQQPLQQQRRLSASVCSDRWIQSHHPGAAPASPTAVSPSSHPTRKHTQPIARAGVAADASMDGGPPVSTGPSVADASQVGGAALAKESTGQASGCPEAVDMHVDVVPCMDGGGPPPVEVMSGARAECGMAETGKAPSASGPDVSAAVVVFPSPGGPTVGQAVSCRSVEGMTGGLTYYGEWHTRAAETAAAVDRPTSEAAPTPTTSAVSTALGARRALETGARSPAEGLSVLGMDDGEGLTARTVDGPCALSRDSPMADQPRSLLPHVLRSQDGAADTFLTPLQGPSVPPSGGLAQRSPALSNIPGAQLSTFSFVSSLRVDEETLQVPLREQRPVRSRHKGVVYYVRQMRTPTGHPGFNKRFLALRVNDTVSFQWFDAAHHVFETDPSYSHVVPGGFSSTTGLSPSKRGKPNRKSDILVPEYHDEAIGKMTFSARLVAPGDYYFVCTKDKYRMRLHVQVSSDRAHHLCCTLVALLGALLAAVLITVVALVLAYWLQKRDLFLPSEDAVSTEQYEGIKKLQQLITLNAFPWLAAGILVLLLVIVLAVVLAVLRRYRPARQGSWYRGVKAGYRRTLVAGTVLLCLGNVVLLFVAYGLQLNVTDGINHFAEQLGSSIISTTKAYNIAIFQMNWLVGEAGVLFPNITLPADDILNTLNTVDNILNDTKRWTRTGEDIAQGAFRVLPILLFLTLQLGLFASSMAVGTTVVRCPKHAAAVAWILAACTGVYACAVGVVWALSRLLSMIYDSAVVFRGGPRDFYNTLGLVNDSVTAQLFSACSTTEADVQFVSRFVRDAMHTLNATLSPTQQREFSQLFGFIDDVVPIGLSALVNYTGFVQANLNQLMHIVTEDGAAVNHVLNMDIFPFLQVLFSVLDTLNGLMNCRILREIVANAIPVLRNDVQKYNTVLMVFLLILFVVSVPTVLFAAGSAYALRHPRRIWYEPRTGRWFRLRYAYKIHRKTLTRLARVEESEVPGRSNPQCCVQHAFYRLLSVKIVCYTASTLMFFDAILLVLFNDIARTIAQAPLIRALSYLGCAQIIFLIAATMFRRAWARRIFHGTALALALGCFCVSVGQATVGLVHFTYCFRNLSIDAVDAAAPAPNKPLCSVTYLGHQLEVAVYAMVICLNSVTLVVTLSMLMVRERKLTISSARRPYVGVLSPIEKCCPRLACVFRDSLNVQRLYASVFIFVVGIFLALITLPDAGGFQIVSVRANPVSRGGDIVQVIDPNVGCNGHSAYCSLRVNQYMWACAHNAHSSLEDGFVAANHYYNITRQLHAGVRSFMIDLWYDTVNATVSDEKDVYLCHGICLAGRRPFRQIARTYREFLDRYPEQVIMIIIEQYVNSTDIARIVHETGLDRYVWYSDQDPPSRNADYVWPTFQELIDKGQRLMMFNDRLATEMESANAPEWLYYAYNFQFENDYETSDVSQWRCGIGRGWCTHGLDRMNVSSSNSASLSDSTVYPGEQSGSSGSSSSPACAPTSTRDPVWWMKWAEDITNCTGLSGPWTHGSDVYNLWAKGGNPRPVASKMATVNHQISNGIGSPVQASKANIPASIQLSSFNCSTYWNQVPNIFAFDYWSIANPLATIDAMNQNLVKYGPTYHFKDKWGLMLMGDEHYAM